MFRKKCLLRNAKIVGSSYIIENGWLQVLNSHIDSLGVGEPEENLFQALDLMIVCQGSTLLPGFIDLHTHGALGADFVFGAAEQMDEIAAFYAEHGVTGFWPPPMPPSQMNFNKPYKPCLLFCPKIGGHKCWVSILKDPG
jgi:N-acetylglucosamine-6-phosphate deacetylase